MTVTLKTIRDRCTEVGSCWIWNQGLNSQGYPQMRANGKPHLVRRVALQLSGTRLLSGYVVVSHPECGSVKCCNPEHLMQRTFGEVLKNAYKRGGRARQSEYVARRSAAARNGLCKLSIEAARAIRASDKPTRDLAADYGVKPPAIRNIRAGKTWREHVTNNSVFNQHA